VQRFLAHEMPVLSVDTKVDTKKKELMGAFRNGGRICRPRGEPSGTLAGRVLEADPSVV
jgi:hypothetical protein